MVETIYKIAGSPRLTLLADLHGRDPAPVLSSLAAHRPSLICVVGDILYGSHPEGDVSPLVSQTNVLPFLRGCAAVAPTFLSLGNHEWMLDEEDMERIAATGVVVLDNCWLERDGLVIDGLTSGYVTDYRRFRATQDGAERYPKKEDLSGIGGAVTASQHQPETAWLSNFASAPGFHILLSHHPEYFPLVPGEVELAVSGHAHGGQWRFFNRGVWCPGQGLWPKLIRASAQRMQNVTETGRQGHNSRPDVVAMPGQ